MRYNGGVELLDDISLDPISKQVVDFYSRFKTSKKG
jgi:hypothetical protein